MTHAALTTAYEIREGTTRRSIEIVGALLAERDALESLLLEALPYVENAETDPAYKPEIVRELTERIRAQIED